MVDNDIILLRGFQEVKNPEKSQSIKEWDGERSFWDKTFYPMALAQQWEIPPYWYSKYESYINELIDTHFKNRFEWLIEFNIKFKSKYYLTENNKKIILVIEFEHEADALGYKLAWSE